MERPRHENTSGVVAVQFLTDTKDCYTLQSSDLCAEIGTLNGA